MGVASIEIPPPASVNQTSRGRSPQRRHAGKRQLQGEMATLLLAAKVPRPIPGDRVRASAHIVFPTLRDRDEDNYRSGLAKALGDALAPAQTAEERTLGLDPMFRWLSNDTPEHFTFGAVTFGHSGLVEGTRTRRPAMATVTLAWGDDIDTMIAREAAALRGGHGPIVAIRMGLCESDARQLADDLVAGRGGTVAKRQLAQLWLLAVLIEQRRRTVLAERDDFDRRADDILAALDPVP